MVIGMIAILASILFPVFAKSREKARGHACLSNLFSIGLALRCYAMDHDGWYPPTEDDLAPLVPRYLAEQKVFQCPSSAPGNIPMGAPANDKLWHGLAKKGGRPTAPGLPGEMPGMGGLPGMGGPGGGLAPPPPSGNVPSKMDTAGKTGHYFLGPGLPPGYGGGMPPPPGEPPLPTSPDAYPEGTIFTSYYYRAGRQHVRGPLGPLCAEHSPNHIAHANVLFSDGNVKSVPEAQWRKLGFMTPDEIEQKRHGGQTDEEGGGLGMPPGLGGGEER